MIFNSYTEEALKKRHFFSSKSCLIRENQVQNIKYEVFFQQSLSV